MRLSKKSILAFSIIPQILVVKLLSNFPEFVEKYYSNGLYIAISKIWRFVFGWIPFSIGDIIYTIAIIYALRWLVINRKRIIKDTFQWFQDVMIAISFLYFVFHLFWAMNYYRLPLHVRLDLDAKYTTEELVSVLDKLTSKTNNLQFELTKNDTLNVVIPYTRKELLQKSNAGYLEIVSTFQELDPQPQSVKSSIYKLPLTYMGFGGYFNPFTGEAQVNTLSPLHKIPTTTCHEQAHQIGYAAENEANFIGALAAMHNPDTYLEYCGYMFALKHCLLELQRRDKELYTIVIDKVNVGILKNYREEFEFWESYQNPLEPIFKSTWNQFLKANNQDKGIESYSYVVALLVNHFKGDQSQMLN